MSQALYCFSPDDQSQLKILEYSTLIVLVLIIRIETPNMQYVQNTGKKTKTPPIEL